MEKMPEIEVAYGLPEKQKVLKMQVPEGTSVRQAAEMSGMDAFFPGLDVSQSKLGIFGKLVAKPDEQSVKQGDRVEIYRPLIADPKAARAKRAEKN